MKFRKLMIAIIIIATTAFVFYFFIYPSLKDDKKILVPNIEGLYLDEAKEELNNLGIKYNIIYQDGKEDDLVLYTIPKYNTLILKNTSIDVYVEKIKEEEIIDFTNMEYDDIKLYLEHYEDLGIKVNISYEIENECDEFIVLSQDVSGKKVSTVNEINIVLSQNDLKVIIPSFIGSSINIAYDFCKYYGFNINTIYVNSIYIKDTIIYQSIDAHQILYRNSNDEILFYVSK